MNITKEEYKANIPECCILGIEEHAKMMYCWGLLSSIEYKHPLVCGICEFNRDNPTKVTCDIDG